MPSLRYERHRPEETTLYNIVRENLATLYAAVDEGAIPIALPRFVRKELDGYLDCGLLCRGFARLRCADCTESRLVAFACKGRGFCPSCLGRKMCATAADLVECVVPPRAPLRQWVLTFPFAWRKRLAYDRKLLGTFTRLFVNTVHGFYQERLTGKSGAVIAIQRTSSDMRLNPHLHAVFLDGTFAESNDGELAFVALSHLSTTDVGRVLERTVKRIKRWLRRRDLLAESDEQEDDAIEPGLLHLSASAVSGTAPPAGPEFRRGRVVWPSSSPMRFDKPLCAALDGFTLHAATRAGGLDEQGREALLKYVLRPAVAKERVQRGPEGLVRIALKRPFADGTVAVDMDPLSLLCRLAASVPPPYLSPFGDHEARHTVRYAGVLGPSHRWRSRIVPTRPVATDTDNVDEEPRPKSPRYRPWAQLLKRTFGFDVLVCPHCGGRMKLLALVTDPKSTTRLLRNLGEPTEPPERAPARGPPRWKSSILRRMSLGAVA